MAHKKAAGTTKNGRDSQAKYLGVKVQDGGTVKTGSIIVRQRGTKMLPGNGTDIGKDHTIFALREGKVKMSSKRKVHFDGTTLVKKVVSVV